MLSRGRSSSQGEGPAYPRIVAGFGPDELTGLGRIHLHHTRMHEDRERPFFTDMREVLQPILATR
jgi:hypothetical protein